MFERAGFIGTGNMGGALASAVSKKEGTMLMLSDRDQLKAERLAAELGALVSTNEDIARMADIIFLGVKPQGIEELLKSISPVLNKRKDCPVLCSMVTGVTTSGIREMADAPFPVIRIMPNTPAAVEKGLVLYCGLDTSEEQLEQFAELMEGAGLLDRIEEKYIDAASAVSGCGPAYAYMFIEALADGGVYCGLPRDKAQLYAAAMLQGAAEMVMKSGKHPGQLKDEVCSPGGTTIAGVLKLENSGFRSAAFEAVKAAYERTLELKK